MDELDYASLFSRLLRHIFIIPEGTIKKYISTADEIMNSIDPDDLIFIATALALNCPIWSDDKHFKQQDKIKIFTTKEIINLVNF